MSVVSLRDITEVNAASGDADAAAQVLAASIALSKQTLTIRDDVDSFLDQIRQA